MTKTQYEQAMSSARGNADAMISACVQRIQSLEELADWAETLLCNEGQADWHVAVTLWRDQKNGLDPDRPTPDTKTTPGAIQDQHPTPSVLEDLQALINRPSNENDSNTPDYLLAAFLCTCLVAFNETVKERDHWYGIAPKPGQDNQ